VIVRILVTGAAGFIGSHVVDAFTAEGHAVTGFDVLPPSVPADEPGAGCAAAPSDKPASGSGDLIRADVRDAEAVAAALRGVDLVCHQASMVGLGTGFADAPQYVSRNDLGTAVLLAEMAAAGVRRLVLASSMVIYGEGRYECPLHGTRRPGPRLVADLAACRFEPRCPDCGAPLLTGLVSEDAPADPRNVYAATKLMQENLAASWARVTGGTVAALRYHNVYGPRMPVDTPYAGVAAIFRSALARGRAPQVFEDGGQLRDFVHVRDVAQANVAAAPWAAHPAVRTFRAFNVASGTPRSVGELATELSTALGGPQPKVTGEYRLGDVRHIVASNERLRTELGWRPRVSFVAGLAEFARLTTPARAT
jgi:dTDP-L-rhamnose 4-epimerase